MKNKARLVEILKTGAGKAQLIAQKTMQEIRALVFPGA